MHKFLSLNKIWEKIKALKSYKSAPLVLETLVIIVIGGTIVGHIFYSKSAASTSGAPVEVTKKIIKKKEPEEKGYWLHIDKLQINVPIVIDVDGKNKTAYFKSLEDGVAHMKGTAKPGEPGNTFIFGHSSYYESSPGNYKKIFATLNDIEENDEIIIKLDNKQTWRYKVKDKEIIEATQTEVTHQDKSKKILTLMTCWPIGTKDKRLVVIANLIE